MLWGCEPTHTSLTEKGVHVVVATYDADPVQWLPWLWHLGLTDAHGVSNTAACVHDAWHARHACMCTPASR